MASYVALISVPLGTSNEYCGINNMAGNGFRTHQQVFSVLYSFAALWKLFKRYVRNVDLKVLTM